MYSTGFLSRADYGNFAGLYEDFRSKAKSEYNFELEPLDYNGFFEAVEKRLIDCIVLYEDERAVGFLVYTTAISEGVELNIIHCEKGINYLTYAKELLKKFLDLTKNVRGQKLVCYPMLGEQKSLISVIARFGFKFIGIEVLRYKINSQESDNQFAMARLSVLPEEYKVVSWEDKYFDDAVGVVNEAFKESSDALFDPRFKTNDGCRDILTKIVKDVYAEFMPESTSVLLYNDQPVGFSFMNITGGTIVNIPIVGILKEHQGKGLSTIMLKHSMDSVFDLVYNHNIDILEINTTTETDNFQAMRLYKNLGFIEDYSYPQAYLPAGVQA